MQTIVSLIGAAITLYMAVIVISIVLSWLIGFGVVNRRNQLVYTVADACYRLTEPALRPIRRRLPAFNGLDLSPMVLILALIFVRDVILRSHSLPAAGFHFLSFIVVLITLYIYIVIISAILSWLIAFDVIDRRNQLVYVIADTLYRITDPALRPIRALLPDLGGIDVSPVILIIGLIVLREGIYTMLPWFI